MSLAHCRVTRIGIAHRFTSFDVGARCACGRKIIEHAVPAALMIVDAPRQTPPQLLAPRALARASWN